MSALRFAPRHRPGHRRTASRRVHRLASLPVHRRITGSPSWTTSYHVTWLMWHVLWRDPTFSSTFLESVIILFLDFKEKHWCVFSNRPCIKHWVIKLMKMNKIKILCDWLKSIIVSAYESNLMMQPLKCVVLFDNVVKTKQCIDWLHLLSWMTTSKRSFSIIF